MSAGSRVSGVPELLEAILLHLPLIDILHAQRVDRTFRDGIKTSPALQRALFLKPISDFSLHFHCRKNDTGPYIKNCLSRLTCDASNPEVPYDDLDVCGHKSHRWLRSTSETASEAVFHPLLTLMGRGLYDYVTAQHFECYEADASWRNMLLMQPPVQSIVVQSFRDNHWHVLKADAGAVGLTFTNLQRFMRRFKIVTGEKMQWLHTTGFTDMPRNSTATQILLAIDFAVDPEVLAAFEEGDGYLFFYQ